MRGRIDRGSKATRGRVDVGYRERNFKRPGCQEEEWLVVSERTEVEGGGAFQGKDNVIFMPRSVGGKNSATANRTVTGSFHVSC